VTESVTAEETWHQDIPWYAIDEWSLRRKLALALAIPVLLAATFGGLRVVSATSEALSFSRLESQVSVLKPAVRMVDSASAVAVAGRSSDQGAIQRARVAFDAAALDLRDAMRTSELTEGQVARLDQALAAAQPLRDSPASTPAVTVSNAFAAVVGHVTVALNEFTGETSDTRLTTIRDILFGQVALNEQRLLTIRATPDSSIDQLALSGAIGEEATAIAAIASNLGVTNTSVEALLSRNQQRLTTAADVAAGKVELPRAQESLSVYTVLANRINDQVVSSMGERADQARGAAIRDSIVTLALLALAVGLALAVARLLLEPITRVRLGALDVAQERLPAAIARIRGGQEPEPIQPLAVHTGEEVGQLARAVDVLHAEAVHLATEQARLREQVSAMFETLSRRSTSLINQQLGLIENLERDEDDPRRLENLFRLDHLAARIRRNGESLLVLAGAAPRSGSGQDLPLGDVVRAAVSEVQDYQRVRISVSDLVIQAGAAPNLVHLFAELIDNALSYSPPDSTVTVASARGVDGGTLVEVSDDGLGMTSDAVASANLALLTGGEVTTETARRMGLYVVGQLAIRHEVTVRIRPNPESTGTIVSVFLPAALLASGRGAPAGELPSTQADAITTTGGPASAPSKAPIDARPTLANLTAVPSLAGIEERSPGEVLAGATSSATPTTLPNMSVVPPTPSDEPGSTVSGLPRRQPGAARGAGSAPPRPAWATAQIPDTASPEQSVPLAAPPSAPSSTLSSTQPEAHPPAQPDVAPPPATAKEETPVAVREFESIRDLTPTRVAETPIFRQLQSSWLSDNENADLPWASEEIDQGWQAAERADSAQPAGRSRSGLPMRRPGSTLVPGQAGAAGNTSVARDPEAIRAHLNRHLAGVKRGRAGTVSGNGAGTGAGTNESRSGNSGSTLLDEEMDRS